MILVLQLTLPMRGTLIKMKNNNNSKIVKKILLAGVLLLFLVSYVSAFCVVRGYIFNTDDEVINATKINMVCNRTDGELVSQIRDISGYLYPFGNWYDDCTYCDKGVYVNAFESNLNLYGESSNKSCGNQMNLCHINVYMNQISEPISGKKYYDSEPNLGPFAKEPIEMPKSNESPQTKVPGIMPELVDYTLYYIIGGIILAIIAFFIIKKYVK